MSEHGGAGSDVDQRALGVDLVEQLISLRSELIAAEADPGIALVEVPESQRSSARNLLHYVALRQHEARPLQDALTSLGLSSLGRAEAHVLPTVDAVLYALRRLAGRASEDPSPAPIAISAARARVDRQADALLGRAGNGRDVRIMVTMPSEAATDYALVRDLVTGGMSCIRINCAHDGPEQWSAMIANLRAVEAEVGRTCRVIMDLAGPKLRTGPLRPGPRVLSVKPRRDERGRVLARAKIRLTASPEADESVALPVVPVIAGWIARLRVGDHLELEDARGRRRSLVVIESDRAGCVAETAQTIFFETGLPIRRRHGRRGRGGEAAGQIGELPALAAPIVVAPGDALVLTRSLESGHPAVRGDNGHVVEPARIGCTLAEVFDAVRPGEPIWFDDGKIGGVIESAAPDHMVVRITHARATGERLGAEKGINLPETGLAVAALTVKDEQDLRFVAAQADAVGLSFVREAWQVDHLRRRLIELEAPDLGLVLKIETRRAFECLPQLLLAAMQFPRAAVMIARGDLAVECGFERLAEIQEEILWIVEAAHLPVIWATQVLESLAAKGRATRAEITDAAMGARAECVMLNKGPYVAEAVRALDDILRRMQDHQQKKRSLLRRLRSWSTHPNGAQGEPQP